jgi:hypothetical protein
MIKIVEEPTIELTQAEFDSYKHDWERAQMFTVNPVSLETFIRNRKKPPHQGQTGSSDTARPVHCNTSERTG